MPAPDVVRRRSVPRDWPFTPTSPDPALSTYRSWRRNPPVSAAFASSDCARSRTPLANPPRSSKRRSSVRARRRCRRGAVCGVRSLRAQRAAPGVRARQRFCTAAAAAGHRVLRRAIGEPASELDASPSRRWPRAGQRAALGRHGASTRLCVASCHGSPVGHRADLRGGRRRPDTPARGRIQSPDGAAGASHDERGAARVSAEFTFARRAPLTLRARWPQPVSLESVGVVRLAIPVLIRRSPAWRLGSGARRDWRWRARVPGDRGPLRPSRRRRLGYGHPFDAPGTLSVRLPLGPAAPASPPPAWADSSVSPAIDRDEH